MTKFILILLVISLPIFARTEELSVVEDGTDLSLLPAEEPVEAPDTPDVTENILPDETTSEMADSAPAEAETPNPLAEENQPLAPEKTAEVEEKPINPEVTAPVITTEVPKDDGYFNHRKSHWLTTFGFEGMKYDLPFDFVGDENNFDEREQELYGARLGFGGQLYVGGGFFTVSKVEGYYNGTLFTKLQNAGPENEDEDVSQIKRTGGIWGLEISQQLGYMFEFRTKNPFMDEWAYLTMEPFVEAGIGVARAYNSLTYYYDSVVTDEYYRAKVRDRLTNAKFGAGFNLTGRSGFFMYAKATANTYDITERRINSKTKFTSENPSKFTSGPIKNASIDPVVIYAIGGGYKF